MSFKTTNRLLNLLRRSWYLQANFEHPSTKEEKFSTECQTKLSWIESSSKYFGWASSTCLQNLPVEKWAFNSLIKAKKSYNKNYNSIFNSRFTEMLWTYQESLNNHLKKTISFPKDPAYPKIQVFVILLNQLLEL